MGGVKMKVGSKVYVYPEVAYGIIRFISHGLGYPRYLIEFSDGEQCWFNRDEIRPR